MSTAIEQPWEALARQWRLLGPPLRPSAADVLRIRDAWVDSMGSGIPSRPLDVLLLGATPELAEFQWGPEFQLTAVDASPAILKAVWPGDTPGRRAVLGDWRRLPVADGSVDLVVCDGGLVALPDEEALKDLAVELERALRPDGCAVFRHFCRSGRSESVGSLAALASAGAVRNFHELKLRLLMALPGQGPDWSAPLDTVWRTFEEAFPDRDALAGWLGCAREVVDSIDAYRGRTTRYYLGSPGHFAGLCPGWHLRMGPAGADAFDVRCPVFTLSPST